MSSKTASDSADDDGSADRYNVDDPSQSAMATTHPPQRRGSFVELCVSDAYIHDHLQL